eukprot:3940799-Rhodomonas_salina.5
MSGTEISYGGTCLRAAYAMSGNGIQLMTVPACYALSGAEIAYGDALSSTERAHGGTCLRAGYAMSGREIAYGYVLSSTESLYGRPVPDALRLRTALCFQVAP